MAPKKAREQAARQVNAAKQILAPEIIAKRTKRHLDELERSNYAEPSFSLLGDDEEDGGGGKYAKGRSRQTISDKRHFDITGKRKKSTMNVRTALLYRKNLSTLIEESGIAHLPAHVPTYLTAVTSPPREPTRLICSVCTTKHGARKGSYDGAIAEGRCDDLTVGLNRGTYHNSWPGLFFLRYNRGIVPLDRLDERQRQRQQRLVTKDDDPHAPCRLRGRQWHCNCRNVAALFTTDG